MRDIRTRTITSSPVASVRRRISWMIVHHARLVAIAVLISLLIASLPTASGTTQDLQRQRAAPTQETILLPSQISRSVAKTVTSIGSWIASFIGTGGSNSHNYQPVAAYMPPLFIDAPNSLTVTAASSTGINLSWNAPGGAVAYYVLERSENINGPFLFVANVTGATTKNDTSVTNLHSYLYRVRAVSATGAISTPSNMALGTAISFQFSSLAGQEIRAQHFHDVRTAINAVRPVANLAAATWARGTLTGLEVKADDVNEMRTALNAALTALAIPTTAYTDPTLSVGANGTLIKAIHIEELQTRSTRGSSSSSGPIDPDSSAARLDPLNETGGGGENPLSRNFNWSLPLVSLPGRAGMDLGLSLVYNSLVWTRISSSAISFDDDNGFPGPGFRLGFPVIQQRYFNSQVGKEAYLVISPDGSRTELRQVGTSAFYESADSSHLLLDESSMILRTTDGTQLIYAPLGGEFKCTEIKDRNGNYISVSYTPEGRINTVTDTLNRVITFNYVNGLLDKITQIWNDNLPNEVTHEWAKFEYDDIALDINFGTMTVHGATDGSQITTLSKVTLADDSGYEFSYTSWGQVFKITRFAADDSPLNYRFYNLPQNADPPAHDDCPRFTVRKDWAKYWNGDTDGTMAVSEEVATATFIIPTSDTWTMPEDTQAVDGMRTQVTTADGTVNKIYYIGTIGTSSGWRRGLRALVDTFTGGPNPVRRVSTIWTQDNTTLPYLLNPRVAETNIRDAANNRARKEVVYQQFALPNNMSCHLPRDIYEYAANASTVLRSTRTSYNMGSSYMAVRVLGLISEREVYEGNVNLGGTLKSKVSFFYDNENGSSSIQGNDAPIQHDNAAYSSSFVAGRGNLSSVKRHNVDNGQFTTNRTRYNTSGDVVSAKDGLDHELVFSYADSFSDGNNSRNTFAYPTTVTDADNYSSTAKYNFDFGAVTYRRTPLPNTTDNTPGPEQLFTFDVIGRPLQTTNVFNGAYTRWDYSASPTRVDTFTTVQDGLGEAHSFTIHDGIGRVVAAATAHPGSSGGFSGERIVFDVMGRMIKSSNPTETHATGVPSAWDTVGDDAAAGWIYTEQTYDWQGRPLVTTNPSMTSNPAQTTTNQVSYSGCGCVGGEVVTFTDEVGRQQKMYTDILGRSFKVETLNWNGSVYSTSVSTYDARDLITQVIQYAGVEGSTTSQTTSMVYDGYGRLQSRHDPENNIGTATTWTYNADDTVSTITDARGASQTLAYNDRHLPITITYGAPSGSGISVPAQVTLDYDGAGNRTVMNDAFGSQSYQYDDISRLTQETRQFPVGNFSISYAYNLVGQLTGVTDPFGATFSYTRDLQGQLKAVSGSPFNGFTNYISDIQYRAWGDPKSVTFASTNSTTAYNKRMLPNQFRLTVTGTGGSVIREDYGYWGDGRLASVTDLDDTAGNNPPSTLRFLSRAFNYDHVGRVAGGSGTGAVNVPFSQSYSYDAFDNLTGRSGSYYNYGSSQPTFFDSATYVNNRRNGWTYNANGQLLSTPGSSTDQPRSMTYDAAGNLTNMVETGSSSTITYSAAYDGDGQVVFETNSKSPGTSESAYAVRSTVLDGEVLTRLTQSGSKKITHVPTFGLVIARQVIEQGFSTVNIIHRNPPGNTESGRAVYDPLGNFIPFQAFADPRPPAGSYSSASLSGLAVSLANPHSLGNGCLLDGTPVNCSLAMRLVNNGSAGRCPQNDCGPRFVDGTLRPLFLTEEGFGVRGEQRKAPTLKRSNKPPKKMTPKQRREAERKRREDAKKGKGNEDEEPPKKILVPLDVKRLEDLMRRTLSYSGCADYIRRLINKASEMTHKGIEDTDIMALFEKIKNQPKGGVLFDRNDIPGHPEIPNVAGGGGWAWGWYSAGNAMINIYRLSYFTDNPYNNIDIIEYRYGQTGVHEVIHLAAKNGLGFTESELTAAAKALEPEKDFPDWDGYLQSNCVPEQYRGRGQ